MRINIDGTKIVLLYLNKKKYILTLNDGDPQADLQHGDELHPGSGGRRPLLLPLRPPRPRPRPAAAPLLPRHQEGVQPQHEPRAGGQTHPQGIEVNIMHPHHDHHRTVHRRYLTKRTREKDEEELTVSDWKFAAMVIDRFCLIGLSIYTVMTTVVMFLSAPHLIVK